MLIKPISLLFLLTLISKSYSQEKPDSIKTSRLSISGFLEVFYSYDFNKPKEETRQPFFYNYNRHNEFNINLGMIRLEFEQPSYRAKLSLQTGTYVKDNYASEPGVLKNIYEANAGIALNKKKNTWVDAGIFESHIGFESAVSTDNWTLTRSFVAENTPYYLTGIKLTHQPDEHWLFSATVCNGWQKIKGIEGNSMLSYTSQIKYTPSEKLNLNWNGFLGTDDPDSLRRLRIFNNFYGMFLIGKKLGLITCLDFGFQQKSKGSKSYDMWVSPVAIARYSINKRWGTAMRAEYYWDEKNLIISAGQGKGFRTSAFSMNMDYHPNAAATVRLEARSLYNRDKILVSKGKPSSSNFFITGSMVLTIK